MTTTTRFATAIATGAVLLNALAPMTFAATTLTITGNGSDSNSTVNVEQNRSTVVNQTNDAHVNNTVNVNADTGHNDANDNTGGNVEVETGDATTDVTVKNMLNTNSADVDSCDCAGDTEVLISGNGSDSDNNVDLTRNGGTFVEQNNRAYVRNDVDVDADTGDNDANDNTGGDVRIDTGDVDTSVKLVTAANVNSARVGGGSGSEGSDVSARIVGNGSDSDNDIDLEFNDAIVIDQDNDAHVNNDVDVDGDSGDNDASDNTGGDVEILTGDVDADVTVDNMVNFNEADAGCGCVGDLEAKISGNGSESDNEITYSTGEKSGLFVEQDNDSDLDNDVDVDGDTGDNDAEDNTGSVDAESDPSIDTGDSDTELDLRNSGNVNVFGEDAGDLEFTFDFGDIFDWLLGNHS